MATHKTKVTKKPKAAKLTLVQAKGRKKAGSSNIVLTMLTLGAVGITGYFCWQYIKRKGRKASGSNSDPFFKPQDNTALPGIDRIFTPPLSPIKKPSTSSGSYDPIIDTPVNIPTKPYQPTTGNSVEKDAFPLKKGSKGERVRILQQALINKNGSSILPRYGADGSFGSEVIAALKKLKLSSTVSETLYNVLTQDSSGNSSSGFDPGTIAKNLFTSTQKKDLSAVISYLKKISNVSEYQLVNTKFQEYRLNGGVRKTLVNGILSTFLTESQKSQIRYEFVRMGLRYDGTKWSLSGLDGMTIATKEPATIWINGKKSITVPAKMVLGVEVSRRLDYTLFENNKKYFLVQTRSVTYM